jgi:putative oxidoreductase
MKSRFTFLTAGGTHADLGLLVLRVSIAGPLLIKHGLKTVLDFSSMAQHFPDPIHIGPIPSLLVTVVGTFLCSTLVILGLATRWAALFSFMNLLVAWSIVHHFAFFAGPEQDRGEVLVLFLGVMLTLILTGPGRYSLDYALTKSNRSNSSNHLA